MKGRHLITAALVALSSISILSQACAEEYNNSLKVGVAGLFFNTDSGSLNGPPGTTPPGVEAVISNKNVLAFSYEYNVSGPWSILIQGGLPPTLNLNGAGTAATLGVVGSARAWFPAVLGTYRFLDLGWVHAYAGAGANYTFYTDPEITQAYTTALGGVLSKASLTSSVGPVVTVGVEFPIADRWVIDFRFAQYWIDTDITINTVTPGVGIVSRSISVAGNPSIVGVLAGFRF